MLKFQRRPLRLVHTTNTDKTRLSCLVLLSVWTEFATVAESFQYIGDRTPNAISNSLDPVSKYDVYVAIWKLGQGKTRLSSHRISRLDKTVSKFSVADSLDLSPIQFTPRTRTRQDLSCPCSRCELAIIVYSFGLHSATWTKHDHFYRATMRSIYARYCCRRLSVRLSVCQSNACIVTKRKHLAKKVQLWLIGSRPWAFQWA